MKTTLKEFLQKTELKKELKSKSNKAVFKKSFGTNRKIKEELSKLEKEYFDKLDTVCISYSIGYRRYYSEVIKIGKQYLYRGEKMTQVNGFSSIKEIPEITQKMRDDMIDDMHYY